MNHIINAAPPLWFLIALAEVILIYRVIRWIAPNQLGGGLSVTVLAIIDCWLLKQGIVLPANLNVVGVMMPIYFAGETVCGMGLNFNKKQKCAIALLAGVILSICYHINGNVNVVRGDIGKTAILYYVNAFCGILVTIIGAQYIDKLQCHIKNILIAIGKRTLGIMCVHMAWIFVLSSFMKGDSIWCKIAIFAITIVMSYGIAVIYDVFWAQIKQNIQKHKGVRL